MKIQIEPTAEVVTVKGVEARAWRGVTEKGVGCVVFVTSICVPLDVEGQPSDAAEEFAKELKEEFPQARLLEVERIALAEISKPSVN